MRKEGEPYNGLWQDIGKAKHVFSLLLLLILVRLKTYFSLFVLIFCSDGRSENRNDRRWEEGGLLCK